MPRNPGLTDGIPLGFTSCRRELWVIARPGYRTSPAPLPGGRRPKNPLAILRVDRSMMNSRSRPDMARAYSRAGVGTARFEGVLLRLEFGRSADRNGGQPGGLADGSRWSCRANGERPPEDCGRRAGVRYNACVVPVVGPFGPSPPPAIFCQPSAGLTEQANGKWQGLPRAARLRAALHSHTGRCG